MMTHIAATNTILQTIVEENKRGRVMSLFTMSFMGTAPLGSLLSGYLADILGEPTTVRLGGACCIVGSVLFALQLPSLRAKVRPIYIMRGILPEVNAGIQMASEMIAVDEKD